MDKRSLVIISLVYKLETNPICTPAMVTAVLCAQNFNILRVTGSNSSNRLMGRLTM